MDFVRFGNNKVNNTHSKGCFKLKKKRTSKSGINTEFFVSSLHIRSKLNFELNIFSYIV